ncbi:MAG: heavy metal translocating P-type ATPase [bacterium]
MRTRFTSLALTVAFFGAGLLARIAVGDAIARDLWMVGVIVMGAPLVLQTVRGAIHGRFAADVVASMSIIGAIMAGQPLVGLVIVFMQTGGEALERFAERRASAAVRTLEAAAPRIANVVRGLIIDEVPATSVLAGEVLLIRPGDLIPCDGVVIDGESELDTSSLTGEGIPVCATVGTSVMSGTLNGLGSFRMRATAPADRSQYARIVELVRTAQASKAPLQRMADRYAVWFTPITIAVCGIAVWLTHDWTRVLAILVVATPCSLILATPVAIIGGINRAAKRFVIIRHGGALERLGDVTAAVFDKTGTITIGKPRLHGVSVAPQFDRDTVLGYAAAIEEHSSHLLARVLVENVRAGGATLPASDHHIESPGQGVTGVVDGHTVRVGARAFVVPQCDDGVLGAAALERTGATLRAYVSIDGCLAGVIEYADEIRTELPHVLRALANTGIGRVVLLSGDHAPIARAVAESVGIGETYGDLLPGDKAQFIERLQAEGHVVMMVGDGTNDAPALSTADVGVALAAHGGGITAEAADVIILIDSLDRVVEAIDIGRRTIRIARQSIWVGLGLSGGAMIVAAFGGVPPLIGAGMQEVIDVAVILNALRTSIEPLSSRIRQRARVVRADPPGRPIGFGRMSPIRWAATDSTSAPSAPLAPSAARA